MFSKIVNRKTLVVFLMIDVFVVTCNHAGTSACSPVPCGTSTCRPTSTIIRSHYEEAFSYIRNPQCKPSNLDKGIKCSAIGPSIEVKGGLVSESNHFIYDVEM